MAMQGNLEDLPFADLLAIVTRREQSGILIFNNLVNIPVLAATVIIQAGKVHAAWIYQKNESIVKTLQDGENALHALLVCPQADFSFKIVTSDYAFPQANIFNQMTDILLANVFQAELFQAAWNEQLTAWEISVASKESRYQNKPNNNANLGTPAPFLHSTTQETTVKIRQEVEITQSHTRSSIGLPKPATPAPLLLETASPQRVQPINTMPKVQRSWISSLMDKIRSL